MDSPLTNAARSRPLERFVASFKTYKQHQRRCMPLRPKSPSPRPRKNNSSIALLRAILAAMTSSPGVRAHTTVTLATCPIVLATRVVSASRDRDAVDSWRDCTKHVNAT
jgi:hypothetical protein